MSKAPATTVFTLRDLNRQPAKVLAAVRKFGRAEIRTRNGEVFTVAVKSAEAPKRSGTWLPDFEAHWKRLRELGAEDDRQVADWRGHRRIPADSDRYIDNHCAEDAKRAIGSPSGSSTETDAVAAGE